MIIWACKMLNPDAMALGKQIERLKKNGYIDTRIIEKELQMNICYWWGFAALRIALDKQILAEINDSFKKNYSHGWWIVNIRYYLRYL